MTTTRSLLVIGRHGIAPKNADGSSQDSINDASIQSMYASAQANLHPVVAELGITPADTFLRWSGRVRTLYTAQATAIGALGLPRTEGNDVRGPGSSADLANFKLDNIKVEEDPRLNFGDPLVNMAVYKATTGAGNIDYWLANPTARMHDGKPIETYESVRDRTGHAVREVVRRITHDKKKLGIVVSHSTIVEPTLIHLINSGRDTPVERVADIGGTFTQEERALMTIYHSERGTDHIATLDVKGRLYEVNLRNLLQ